MEWLLIYVFVMIEKLSGLLSSGYAISAWSLGFLAIMAVCIFLYWADSDKEEVTLSGIWAQPIAVKLKRILLWSFFTGLIFGVLSSLLPSQKQLAVIVGSGLTYQAVTSDQGKRIGGKAVDLLEKQIDDALKDEKAVTLPPVVTEKAKEIVKEAVK